MVVANVTLCHSVTAIEHSATQRQRGREFGLGSVGTCMWMRVARGKTQVLLLSLQHPLC